MKLNYTNLEEQKTTREPEVVVIADSQQIKPQIQPQQQVIAPNVNSVDFTPIVSDTEAPSNLEQANNKATEVVSGVFNQALLHAVRTDKTTNEGLVETAKQVIKNKADAIADEAETESKVSLFKKHKDACGGFGYDETTTPKSLVKQMSVIAYMWNLLYIYTLGMLIVYPISFFCQKIKVVVKTAWVAFVLALIVYLMILFTPLLISWVASLKIV